MTYDLATLAVSVALAFATGYGLAVIHDDRRHRRDLYEREKMRAAADRHLRAGTNNPTKKGTPKP